MVLYNSYIHFHAGVKAIKGEQSESRTSPFCLTALAICSIFCCTPYTDAKQQARKINKTGRCSKDKNSEKKENG